MSGWANGHVMQRRVRVNGADIVMMANFEDGMYGEFQIRGGGVICYFDLYKFPTFRHRKDKVFWLNSRVANFRKAGQLVLEGELVVEEDFTYLVDVIFVQVPEELRELTMEFVYPSDRHWIGRFSLPIYAVFGMLDQQPRQWILVNNEDEIDVKWSVRIAEICRVFLLQRDWELKRLNGLMAVAEDWLNGLGIEFEKKYNVERGRFDYVLKNHHVVYVNPDSKLDVFATRVLQNLPKLNLIEVDWAKELRQELPEFENLSMSEAFVVKELWRDIDKAVMRLRLKKCRQNYTNLYVSAAKIVIYDIVLDYNLKNAWAQYFLPKSFEPFLRSNQLAQLQMFVPKQLVDEVREELENELKSLSEMFSALSGEFLLSEEAEDLGLEDEDDIETLI